MKIKITRVDFNQRNYLRTTVIVMCIILHVAFIGCNLPSSDRLPNIIIILTDDQGYADLGCYGARHFSTPNIDQLAAEGMRFTDFYDAAPVCTPSRAALLTGCYPVRVGLPVVLAPPGPPWTKDRTNIGIDSAETTIAEMLRPLGYATACFGKWHLGYLPRFLPTQHGFDEYFGLPYSNDMRPENDENYPPLPLIEGEKAVQYNPDQSHLTTWYTEKSIQFIEKNKDRPFFLYIPHSMPHVPLYVSEKFKGKSKQGLYGDVIMEIDWSVGEITNKLKQLDLADNTLIIFTSDNGPWLVYGNHAGSALPLREGKMTTFEGGQRVPCIMKWPRKIPAGSTCAKLVTTMDILPTIASLTGAALPSRKIDGKDINALLHNPDIKSPTEVFYYYYQSGLQAIRRGQWKLHLPHTFITPIKIGQDGLPGVTENLDLPLSLFNLESDPGEKKNLVSDHPEIVAQLSQMAKQFDTDLKKNIRGPGKAKE